MAGIELEEKQTDAEKSPPPEDNEPIGSAADLEQEKKRTAQEFYAQGNVGTTQIFIGHLDSMSYAPQKKQEAPAESPGDKTYSLGARKECAAFVERYKNSEHLAVAIVLSVFELVYIGDLPELTALLMEELPEAVPTGEDAAPPVRDPYISMDTFLSAINGEWFTNQTGKQYVGLGKSAQEALRNFWEQFPALRDPMCRWLIRLSRGYRTRTTFDAYQMVCAFARVSSLDFEDAKKRILNRLYSNQENMGLLGNLVCKLYAEAALRGELEGLLMSWLRAGDSWLWQPACLACSFLMPGLRDDQFGSALERAANRHLICPARGDTAFLAVLMLQSEYFRTLLARLLHQMEQRAKNHAERQNAAQTYLYLLRNSYYRVDHKWPELPLAACDTKEQQQALAPLLAVIMGQTALRRQLYAILRAYLEELDHYQPSHLLYDHLCAYFYNLIQSNPTCRQEVLAFLSGCQGTWGPRLRDRLRSVHFHSQGLASPL